MKQRLLIFVVCLFLLGTLVACGNGHSATNPTEDENVLTAMILHIDDVDVLVEIAEDDDIWYIPQRIGFHRVGLNDIGAVVGDIVMITYTVFETETYPAWIEATDWTFR